MAECKLEKGHFLITLTQEEYKSNFLLLSELGIEWLQIKNQSGYSSHLPYEFVVFMQEHTNIKIEFPDTVKKMLEKKIVDIDFVRKPYPHQLLALKYLFRFGSAPFLLDMGTGKTKVILDLFKMRKKAKQVRKLLAVCPCTCVQVWEEESKKENLHCLNLRKLSSEKIDDYIHFDYDIYILNFELLKRLFTVTTKKWKRGTHKTYTLRNAPFYKENFMLACDESSKIKNPKAQQAKQTLLLSDSIAYKNILTGTLTGNDLSDTWSQISVVSKAFKNDYTKFKSHFFWFNHFFTQKVYYSKSGKVYRKDKVVPKSKIKETIIKDVCTAKAFVYTREQLNLPPKTYSKRYIELGTEQKKYYGMVKKQIYTEWEEGTLDITNVGVRIQKLAQITSGFVYLKKDDGTKTVHRFKQNVKIDMLKEIFEELDIRKKYIVWHFYKEDGKIVAEEVEKIGMTPLLLEKGSNFNQSKFNKLSSGVLIANQKMIGYGHTLKGVEHVIYYSNQYSYLDRAQSEARTQRIGIEKSCNYIDLICKNTIDEYIISVIKRKESINVDIKEHGLKRLMESI